MTIYLVNILQGRIHSEPSRTSKMEAFPKIGNDRKQ